jgi:hypothetical protein
MSTQIQFLVSNRNRFNFELHSLLNIELNLGRLFRSGLSLLMSYISRLAVLI